MIMKKILIAVTVSTFSVLVLASTLGDIFDSIEDEYSWSRSNILSATNDILSATNALLGEYANTLGSRNIIVYQNSLWGYRLNDNILRQESLGIAVKLGNKITLPNNYSCKWYFRDVTSTRPNTWACRIAELGADSQIITRSRSDFYPERSITRAEALAMLMWAAGLKSSTSTVWYFDSDAVDWQKKLILSAYQKGILDSTFELYPNSLATRGDIIYLAYKIGLYTWTISGTASTPQPVVNVPTNHNGNWSWNMTITSGVCWDVTFNFTSNNGIIEGEASDGGLFSGIIYSNGSFVGSSWLVDFSWNISGNTGSGTARTIDGSCTANIFMQKS